MVRAKRGKRWALNLIPSFAVAGKTTRVSGLPLSRRKRFVGEAV